MVKLLKYSWLVLLFVVSGFVSEITAQDSPILILEGRITNASGKKIPGATIVIKKNGSQVASTTSASTGKYSGIELPMGFVYEYSISAPGYVPKKVVIDTKTGYYAEDMTDKTFLDLPIGMDEMKPDVDYSPITGDFVIGKLSIDPASGGLAPDMSYSSGQKSKYEKFFKKLEDEANKEEEDFKKYMQEGDKAFAAGNYTDALSNFQQAQQIKANDPSVVGKISTTEQKIEQKKSFDKTVAEGDNALNSKSYDQAIAKYEAAKSIMPDDKGIDAKIKAAQEAKAAAEGAELDAKFQAKMKEADKAFTDKDYAYAKSLYQEAGTIKPDEKQPPIKIKECDDIIKDQLAKEQQFNELVAAGDKGMLDEAYDTSIEKYTEALKIKDDSRVQSELEKAKDLKKKKEEAEANAAKQTEFDGYIDAGDGKLSSEDFDGAIAQYTKALDMNFDNATANTKIKEAEAAKQAKADQEAAAAKQAEFDQLIAEGDGKLGSEDFDGAITKYNDALTLGVDNAKANAKIAEAEAAKKAKEDEDAAAAKAEQFNQLITDGDGKLGSEDFDGAIAKYKEALALGVDDPKANSKISEAEAAKKAKEDEDAAAAKAEQFNQLIADGDGKLGSEDFDGAIAKYKEALALGVDDPKANSKISEAEAAKKAKEDEDAAAAKAEQFSQLIADGDGKLGSEDFDGAIAKYNEALALGVDDPKANSKIAEAEAAKKAKEDQDAAAAKEEQFGQLITDGDGKLGSEDFDGAIAKYKEALALGVDDPKANSKIAEAEAAKQAKADQDAELAKQQQFDQLIADGDGKLGSKDFDSAISNYQQALDLDVDNPTANTKIKEAEEAKAAYEAEMAAKDEAEQLKQQFDQLISNGDGKVSSKDFDGAIADFEAALALGVDDPLANQKIQAAKDAKQAYEDELAAQDEAAKKALFDEKIKAGDDKVLANSFDGAISDYEAALAMNFDNDLANQKIQAAKDAKQAYEDELAAQDEAAKKALFDEKIRTGDSQLTGKNFDGAISDFEAALAMNFDNDLANQKIQEAKDAKAAYEAELAAQGEAAKQAEFDKYINSGDGHLSSNAFDMAINEYQSALDLNVNNSLANQKIQAAKDAKSAYESESAADAAAAALEKKFNDLIAQGDAAKNSKDWNAAKDFYGQAQEVKNDSPIPQEKIDEVNRLMKEQLEDEQDAQFQKYLEKGREITQAGEYDKAIGLYTKAKGLFPAKEDVLNTKIDEVSALKAKEDEYSQYMASADGLFESGKWKEARADYVKARKVFDRPRPSEQIALIDQKLADAAAANDAAADLAKKKAEYEALMGQAKTEREGKKYQEAIATYKKAQQVLPEELEPQKRIDEINDLLANMASENALLEKYQEAIAKADAKRDEAIAAENDDLAIAAKDLYTKANQIMSDESYPQEQVNRLSNLMEEWANKAIDVQYQKIIDKADELFADKNWDGAEKLYSRAKDLKPIDPYPPAQLEKIKNARNKEGQLDAYNQFVQEGNSLFQEAKYKNAIAAYQNALGEKPSAKYPQDKIDEINGILSQMSQKAEKERIEEERNKVIIPDYGDEISMTEEEIEKMWSDARVDEITSLDEDYDRYKEKVDDENTAEIGFQTGRTDAINDSYEEMDQDLAEKYEFWDQQRKDILPEMEDLKEREKDKLRNFSSNETDRTYDLDEYYTDSETDRAEYETSLDVKREQVISDLEIYKLDRSEINLDLAEVERDLTDENNEYYDDYEVERQLEDLSSDERRTDNVENMHDYKEDQIDINNLRVDRDVTSTYETHGDYREMDEQYEQFAIDGDERRKEETVAQMDDYKEVQSDINLTNHKESIEKTDGVNDYNVSYHDYLDDFADEMDIPREDNVSAMEVYQNDMSDNHKTDLEINEKRSQENYLDKDKIKEEQAVLFIDESTMVEANMENVEAYKDKKSNQASDLNQEFSNVGYDNFVTMDSIKAQKATMFSDENVDPLANQYPEGITEKTYQRTNNIGEVIEVTIVRIVVHGNKADEYKKVTSKWNTAYFKNGGIINEYIWDTETN